MAAGQGFKTFATGDVLSASDVNGYLMQGVLVFADATERNAEITSPQEGQFAYLKDTNVTTYYTGSAWANLDTTGMTNPMTTTGDTIYSSSGSTPARLGIGSTGQVLTVAGGVPSWATPGSAGATSVIQTITTTGGATNVSFTSIPSTFQNLRISYQAALTGTTWDDLLMRINNDTGANYDRQILMGRAGSASAAETYGQTSIRIANNTDTNGSIGQIIVPNYKTTTFNKMAVNYFFAKHGTSSTNQFVGVFGGTLRNSAAVTQIDLFNAGSLAFVNGSTFTLYGEA
jgi:hypothetical protein